MYCTIETVTERPAVFDVDNDQMAPENVGERQIKEDNVQKSPTPPRRHPQNVIPIVFSNSLHDGACFIDDKHFRQVYDAHRENTRAGFRIVASERTVNMGDEISAQFEYNYVKFQCPRVGKPRIRGYMNQGCCPANIFLKFNRENFCYQITRCSLSHSHPLVAPDVLTAAKTLHRTRSSVPRTPKSRAEVRQRYASRTPASSRGVVMRETPSDLDDPSSSLPEMSLSLPSQTLPELVEVQNRLNLRLQILQNLNFQPASVQNPLNLQPQPIDQTNDQENNPSMAAITNQFSAILNLNELNPNEPTLPLPNMEQLLQHMNFGQ